MEVKLWIKYWKVAKIIAVDPGKAGGVTVRLLTGEILEVIPMPETPHALWKFLQKYKVNSRCYLERVGGMPGNGGNRMFNFGEGVGYWKMACVALKIPLEIVPPQQWQKTTCCGVKGNRTQTAWKNFLKEKAQALFPKIKVTLFISDSLLISEHAILVTKSK